MLASMSDTPDNHENKEDRLLNAKQMSALEGMRLKGTNAAAARAATDSYSTASRWKVGDADFSAALHETHE